jgi:ferredoxin-NADP reductase
MKSACPLVDSLTSIEENRMQIVPLTPPKQRPHFAQNDTADGHGKHISLLRWLALISSMAFACPVFAQSDASEHATHHPSAAAQTPKPSSPGMSNTTADTGQASKKDLPKPAPNAPGSAANMPGAMPADGMGAMGQMMQGMMAGTSQGCCGGDARTEIYPFLMNLPSLTAEQRTQVQRLSAERIGEGKALTQAGQQRLSVAIDSGDHKVAAEAIQQLRDGIGRIDSGVAAHKMLQESTPPQVTATRWFKSEMNIDPVGAAETGPVLQRLSLIHLIAMALLVAFAIAMAIMYFFKMRRTAALFGRIEAGVGKPPPGSAPPLVGKPVSPPPLPPTSGSPIVGGASQGDMESANRIKKEENSVVADSGPNLEAPRKNLLAAADPVAASLLQKTARSIPNAKWGGLLCVTRIITETPNVKTVRLGPTAGEATLPFTFLPGQFLNVTFMIGGARMNRSYSISSSPAQRDYLDLTVKREQRGAVSRHIADLLKVSDKVEAGGPVGRFTFDGTEADSIVLISGGVGITPMMSISRYLTQQSWPHEIFFIYACRSPIDFIFANDIAELERLNPKFYVTVVMEHPEGTGWQGRTGRLSKEVLAQSVPDITSRRIHICGPAVMMDAVRALLEELKVPSVQVRTEDFGTAAPTPTSDGLAKFATPATGPLVTFSKNNKSAKIHVDQTLLELSEELKIGIEFSCRVGTCGICKVKLTAGEVDMAIDDALDADDKMKGIVLACQAKPTSAVTVEA